MTGFYDKLFNQCFFFFTNKNHGNIYLRVLTTHFCVNTEKNKINMWQIKVITEREKDLVYVALPEPENTLGQQVNSSSLITVKKYFSKDYRLFAFRRLIYLLDVSVESTLWGAYLCCSQAKIVPFSFSVVSDYFHKYFSIHVMINMYGPLITHISKFLDWKRHLL